ncbi:MAG: ABC transporter permease [Acidimicrobiales bacterium]
MGAVIRSGLLAQKRRLVGTFLAVFLGVAFLTGTLVLGDTMGANFDELFTEVNAGTDAVVRSATRIEADIAPGLVDQSLVGRVAAVEGVANVEPSIEGFGQLVGSGGEAIGGNGPPTVAGNWIDDPDLNPYRIVDGRAPRAPDEVVVNRGAALDGDLGVGDTTTVRTPQPVPVRIVGIATFGSADGLGTVTFTAFTLEGAQQHVTKAPGRVTSAVVRGRPDVSQDELLGRIGAVLPPGVEAISGQAATGEDVDTVNQQFLDLFRRFLVVFAAVALLVATFSIYNTFSILVAQRTRQSALLRAIGAGRGQLLVSFVAEASVVGLVAAAAGLVGGVGIAALLKGLLAAFGFPLPTGGLVFTATTAAVALTVGVAVTLLAGALPAVRASRVAPLAALRDVSVERAGASPPRVVAGLALTAVGVAVVLSAAIADGAGVASRAGLGAVLTMVGVVVCGPVVARPASGALGWPLPALRGITGALARQNAMRNPRRTAGSASALMVGVGVVTLFTVFASSLSASIDRTLSGSFAGDLVISAGRFGDGGLSAALASEIGELAEVRTAVGLGAGNALVDGESREVSVADPDPLARVFDLEVTDGSLADLGDGELAVAEGTALDRGWELGTTVPVTFADGTTTDLAVGALYQAGTFVEDLLLPRATWSPHSVQDLDATVFVELADGVDLGAGKSAVQAVAQAFGAPDVEDRQEYVDSVAGNVTRMLGLVYVLLGLAVVIAAMGIANSLSLAVHERTRELGLLRAVGQTRGQLRSMVRWESVIIALFGTTGGLGLGVFLGWALVRAVSEGGPVGTFAAPLGPLAVVLVAGAVVGVVAGLRPARRAAGLNILLAIAAE